MQATEVVMAMVVMVAVVMVVGVVMKLLIRICSIMALTPPAQLLTVWLIQKPVQVSGAREMS